MTLTNQQTAILRLFRGRGIGPTTFYKLLEHYGDPQTALEGLETENKRLKPAPAEAVQRELARLEKMAARLVFYTDDIYPAALRALPDAPPVVAALGRLELLNTPMVAMVGARNASANGCRLAQNLAAELGAAGWGVASGLARGIDTAAHKGALRGGTGTIAVLGGGLDHIYPTENTELFKQIAREGLILAETPLGAKPTAQSFPRRNRIVSGLCAGTVVVEAARHSGSLITAQQAGEQGREVMAIPGHPSEPRSYGCNHLLRQGATLVSAAEDILEAVKNFRFSEPQQAAPTLYTRENQPAFELDLPAPEATPDRETTPAHQNNPRASEAQADTLADRILAALSTGQTPLDDVMTAVGESETRVLAAITELELDGAVERLAGGYLVLAQSPSQ